VDIIEFIEKYYGIKLLQYQKRFIKYICDHPNAKIVR